MKAISTVILSLIFSIVLAGQIIIGIRPGVTVIETLTITSVSADLAAGTVDAAYSEILAGTGGSGTFAWTLQTGSTLPPGLTLNSSTGEIAGTPSAPGNYNFTVCLSDAQTAGEACAEPDVWDDAALSITIDPAAPGGGLILDVDGGDDSDPVSLFASVGSCTDTVLGVIDGTHEITKSSATECKAVDGRNDADGYFSFDLWRVATDGKPATSQDEFIIARDSSNVELFSIRVENDFDVFAKTASQTGFELGGVPRGFYLGVLAADTGMRVQVHKAGTLFEARTDGGSAQTFNGSTATSNINEISFKDANDGVSAVWTFDRVVYRTDTWHVYVPPVPGGGAPPPTGSSLTGVYGATCDGVADDGPEIQAAFDDIDAWDNRALDFPVGATCRVASKLSITGESNFTITGNGSTIKAANGLTTGDGTPLISWTNLENITVNNLDADGNRANRTPTGNIGGHTWQWNGVRDSTFRDIDLINNAGDGIRVSASNSADTATFSKNVTVIDSKFHNSFRDGISIIAGWNIRFLGDCTGNAATGTCTCQFTSSNGGNPQAGFNIEPNDVTADPAAQDNVVDGCLMADNGGSGWSTSNKSANQDNTVQNSIIRNNGSVSGSTPISLGALGDIVQDNQIGIQAGCRFGLVYMRGGSSDLQAGIVQNNTITGTIPVCSEGGGRHAIWYGTGNSQTDGTAQFKTNTMTSIGTAFNGDWCRSGVAGGSTTTSGNTIDGTLQAPNPGCP